MFKVLGPQVIRLNYLQVINMGIDVYTKIDNVNSHIGKQGGKQGQVTSGRSALRTAGLLPPCYPRIFDCSFDLVAISESSVRRGSR